MRDEDGKIVISAEFDYEGRIDINETFDLSGWTPVLDMNIGFSVPQFAVEMVSAAIQAEVEPISFSQEITRFTC